MTTGAVNPLERKFEPHSAPTAQEQQQEPEPAAEVNPPEPQKFRVGGRERTLDEVLSGYEASTQEAVRLRAELEAERRMRDELARMNAAPPPPNPVEEKLRESDLDPEAFREFVRVAARAEIQEALRPLAEMQMAVQEIKKGDPGFDPAQAAEIVNADPRTKAVYDRINRADPGAALEYAWSVQKARGQGATQPTVPITAASAAVAAAQPKRSVPQESPQAEVEKHLKALAEMRERVNTGQASLEDYYRLRAQGTSFDRREDLEKQGF